MIGPDYLRMMAYYNSEMNRRLYAAAANSRRDSSFRSRSTAVNRARMTDGSIIPQG